MKHRSSLIVIAMLLEEGKRCANIMSVYLVFIPSNLVRLALIFRLLCNVTNSFFFVLQVTLTQTFRPTRFITLT